MKKRLDHYDLISGLFIVQIIMMHILQFAKVFDNNTYFTLVMHISFFFMPWFYFKSGYFHKNDQKLDKQYLKTKAKKLLIPFISFFIIGSIIQISIELYEAQRPAWRIFLSPFYQFLQNGNGGSGNLPLWFLISLFFTNIIYTAINQYNLKWVIIMFPIIGYILQLYHVKLPLGINNLFLAIFFYFAGNIFHKLENTQKIIQLIIAVPLYILNVFYCNSYVGFMTNTLAYGDYFIYIISSLAGIILLNFIGSKLNYLKPINYIGKNSFIYYVLHWPILNILWNILKHFSWHSINYIISLLSLVIFIGIHLIIPTINTKLKFSIGKK